MTEGADDTGETVAGDAPAPAEPAPAEPDAVEPAPAEPDSFESAPAELPASGRIALGWLDETALDQRPAPADLRVASMPYVGVAPDLLARRPHRSPLRAGTVIPVLSALGVAGAYAGATLLWPLHAVAPTVTAVEVAPITAPATTVAWPAAGSAAISVDGIGAPVASTVDAQSMASITKLVSSLMILDEMPLEPGEQGPEFEITSRDRVAYNNAVARGESALPVPVGGTLTEYQLLQGILIGSAGNYTELLVDQVWPSDAVFARAATTWLSARGFSGITVVEPTGIDPENRADPASVIALAERALANPVIAEIVRTPTVEIPGAGTVENTNDLLVDPSIAGVKTGSLSEWFNLVAAKDVTVAETPLRLYATALGQPDDAARDGETQRMLDALAAEVAIPYVLPAGTIAGSVSTPWGESVRVVTSADADVILWNGAVGESAQTFDFDGQDAAGDEVGSLSITGPLDAQTVALKLEEEIEAPSNWWRLTHPLELWGLRD